MAILSPLATVADAAEYGLVVSAASLLRASARIRAHLGQQVTRGSSVVVLPESSRRLPERPVVSVESVTGPSGAAVAWSLSGDQIETSARGPLLVAYTHGFDVLPDELVELVCTVAARLGSPSATLSAGVQSQQVDDVQVTYGWDAYKAASGLSSGEKDALRRIWPSIPRTITLGAPA